MKSIREKTLKTLSRTWPTLAEESAERYWIHPETQTHMSVRRCTPKSGASTGDMIVCYEEREVVVAKYRRAIRVLALDEKVEKRLLDFDRLEALRSELRRIVGRIHLWEYAPEDRDAVKAARLYLHTFLAVTIPYGQEIVVPAEDMIPFLNDPLKNFGVSTYDYCQEAPEYSVALDTLVERAKTAEHTIKDLGPKSIERLSPVLAKIVPETPKPFDLLHSA